MSSWWPLVQWQTSKVVAIKVTTSEVVDVIIAPELEGVDGIVEVLPVAVVKVAAAARLEGVDT